MRDEADRRDEAPEAEEPLDLGAPIHVPYEVEVPGFSGPLELLLHLCRKHKIDILDIPVGFITQQYLEYLAAMKTLNLDVAAEYLEMAATLTRIKSRMLLPTGADVEEPEGPEEQGDPRAELVRRLLEYQKYRDAADRLAARPQLDRDVFVRRGGERVEVTGERPLAEVGLGALLDAIVAVLKRVGADAARQITVERVSVAQRIQELVTLLQERRRVRFEQLFEGSVTRFDVVVTFLALLEMTKLRMTRLLQAGLDAPLLVEFVGAAPGGDVPTDAVTADAPPPSPEPADAPAPDGGPPSQASAEAEPAAEGGAPETPDDGEPATGDAAAAGPPPFPPGRERRPAEEAGTAEEAGAPVATPPEAPPAAQDKRARLDSALSDFLAGRDRPPEAAEPGDEEKPE